MAAKVTSPATRQLGLLAAALLLAAAGYWLLDRQPARIRAGLPARPDLTRQPAELADLISDAETRARQRRTAVPGLIELGSIYHANGFVTEADACWRLVAAEQPQAAKWPYLQADLRRRKSDYPAMAAWLEKTTALDPGYAPAWLRLADYEFKTGAIESAAKHYARRLTLIPGDAYARLGLIRIFLQQGRRDEARQLTEALLATEPRFASGQNLYAEMLAASGDSDGARLHRWLGREAGRYREAEDPWLDELTMWCRDPHDLQRLATVQFQTSKGDRGRARMEQALRLAPTALSLREALGDLYLKLAEPAPARATLEQGLAGARPSSVSIPYYIYINQACRQLGQAEDAQRFVRQGLAAHPDAFELHNALGLTLEDLGRPDEALATYHRGVELSPGDAECNFNLATVLLRAERYAEARPYLQHALTLQPTFPKALKVLAQLELAANRPEAATEFLLPLYEAQPGDPQVRDLMVDWHLQSGRPAGARKILEESLMIARLMGNAGEIAHCQEALRRLP